MKLTPKVSAVFDIMSEFGAIVGGTKNGVMYVEIDGNGFFVYEDGSVYQDGSETPIDAPFPGDLRAAIRGIVGTN